MDVMSILQNNNMSASINEGLIKQFYASHIFGNFGLLSSYYAFPKAKKARNLEAIFRIYF